MKAYTLNGEPLDILKYIATHVLTYPQHIIPISKLELGQSIHIDGDLIACVPATPEIYAIEQINFSNAGPDDDLEARLVGPIKIDGVDHHMELIEVVDVEIENGMEQRAKNEDLQESYDEFYIAAAANGKFHTVELNGKTYACFITPYCNG